MSTPVEHTGDRIVNRTAVPDVAEPRWVVLVCTTKLLYDPETSEDESWGIEYTLEHAISPKTGASASANDPDTWGDHWAARQCKRQVNYRIERGEFGGTYVRDVSPGFAADDELYVHIIGCQPEPIDHGRPARVRWSWCRR